MTLTERDQQILNHVARYHLTFHEVVSWLFFDGGDPRRTLNRLEKAGLLAKIEGLHSSRKAFRLDRAASAFVDASRRQLEPPRATSLQFDLDVFAYCLLCGRSRVRLLPSELLSLYGEVPPGKCHVLEDNPKETRVVEVYVPGPKTDVGRIVRAVTESVTKSVAIACLDGFIRNRLYGHAVLVDNRQRQEVIKQGIDSATGPNGRRLRQCAFISVAIVPGQDELKRAFDALGPKNKTQGTA